MRLTKSLILRSTAIASLMGGSLMGPSLSASAQVEIDADTTQQILTSTAGTGSTASDVTINSGVTVSTTGQGPAVIVDSDNTLENNGTVRIDNVDDATAVELQGGTSRSYSQSGIVGVLEDFTTNNDDDQVASGSGRTGILISGASPFQGNIELDSTSQILVEGKDSFGVNFTNTPMMSQGLTGDLNTNGAISVFGQNSIGVNVANGVSGDLNNTGAISARGEAAQSYVVSGDIQGGFVNSGTLLSTATLSAENAQNSASTRALVFKNGAILEEFDNSGNINAIASENTTSIYADTDNPAAIGDLEATAIDIESGADITRIENTDTILAIVQGRKGTATAIRDASGNLTEIDNQSTIQATGVVPNLAGDTEGDFTTVAIDVSANTTGFTYTQSQSSASIQGDILLGSGDDTINASGGTLTGDVDFGGGTDTLTLADATFTGEITGTNSLGITATNNAEFNVTSTDNINVSTASFDDTSTFSPTIDGTSISTLAATGTVSFANGAVITPNLTNITASAIDGGAPSLDYDIATSGGLTIGDINNLGTEQSSFLYKTSFALDSADPNTLILTLDLRDPESSLQDGGLGLDSVQSTAFGSVSEPGPILMALASTPALDTAVAGLGTSDEFYSAINQLLPEFTGAGVQYIHSSIDGATGAVGAHLDTTRRSPEKPGGIWLEQFAYFADRDLAGLSEQYRGGGFGFTGGLDREIGPFHAVGLNLGLASTKVENVLRGDDPMDILSYQAGLYAGLQSGGFNLDLYGGGGTNKFEQVRQVSIGSFDGTASGDWKGTHYNGSLRAGYDIPLSEKFWMRPMLSLDYLNLSEDGYSEDGTAGVRVDVKSRETERASATVMMNFGANFKGKRTWIKPSIRAGYRNDFISDPVETSFKFTGLSATDGTVFDTKLATLRNLAFPDQAFLLGFSVTAGSHYSSIGFDFDSDIRDGFIRHTARVVVRLLF